MMLLFLIFIAFIIMLVVLHEAVTAIWVERFKRKIKCR